MALTTRFTELFDLTYPIMSAPMSGHSGGVLAAAVSEAGDLGSFGGTDERGPDWVREHEALTLEEGVRRLTSVPADFFGIARRGRIAPGLLAEAAAGFMRAHGFKSVRSRDPLDMMKRLWVQPTFEVHGLTGGYTGPGVKTIIPPRAELKISMRLVPDQDPAVKNWELIMALKSHMFLICMMTGYPQMILTTS